MKEAQVKRLLLKWAGKLGLGDWDVDVVFPEANYKDTANCDAAPEYKQAVVYLNLTKIDESHLQDYIRHELLHAILWPLASIANDLARGDAVLLEQVRKAEERVCTDLETMPLWDEVDGSN